MGFGEKLKKLRKEKKLRQEDVAKEVGISVSSYIKYESEIRTPRDDIKKGIAKYYDTSVQDIFF